VALSEGAMAWDDYAKHLNNSATRELCKKVSTFCDPQAEAAYPANLSGTVKIKTTKDLFSVFVEVPKGEPDNFMSPVELREKFDGLCSPYLDETQRDRLVDALLSLEDANSVSSVFALSQMGVA